MVSDLIAAEANYVNTGHPDFINGHKAMSIVTERLQVSRQSILDPKLLTGGSGSNRIGGGGSGNIGSGSGIGSGSHSNSSMVGGSGGLSGNSPNSSTPNLIPGTNIEAFPGGDGNGFFNSFFAKKKKPGVLENVS